MAVDSYEEEQVEALKRWWKTNGGAVILGISLGLAALVGWRGWQAYTQSQAEQASALYQQSLVMFSQDKVEQGRGIAEQLLQHHPGSTYSALASLLLAAEDVKNENLDSAKARLDWVIKNADFGQLTQLARLRKARVLHAQEQYDQALQVLEQDRADGLEASFQALKGDIYLAKGQTDSAREAYRQALKLGKLSAAQHQLLQMKLENLGMTDASSEDTVVMAAFATPDTAEIQEKTSPAEAREDAAGEESSPPSPPEPNG